MSGFILRLLISSSGLWIASVIIPGLHIAGIVTLLLSAFLLGIVNAFIRPIIIVLTFPMTIFTFGFFLLIINAAMFGLVAFMLDGFSVDGFFSALFGSIVVSLTSGFASRYIGHRGRIEPLKIGRDL